MVRIRFWSRCWKCERNVSTLKFIERLAADEQWEARDLHLRTFQPEHEHVWGWHYGFFVNGVMVRNGGRFKTRQRAELSAQRHYPKWAGISA